MLARALGDRDVLLVLDNVEHVLPAAPAIAAVLAVCVIVTETPPHLRKHVDEETGLALVRLAD